MSLAGRRRPVTIGGDLRWCSWRESRSPSSPFTARCPESVLRVRSVVGRAAPLPSNIRAARTDFRAAIAAVGNYVQSRQHQSAWWLRCGGCCVFRIRILVPTAPVPTAVPTFRDATGPAGTSRISVIDAWRISSNVTPRLSCRCLSWPRWATSALARPSPPHPVHPAAGRNRGRCA